MYQSRWLTNEPLDAFDGSSWREPASNDDGARAAILLRLLIGGTTDWTPTSQSTVTLFRYFVRVWLNDNTFTANSTSIFHHLEFLIDFKGLTYPIESVKGLAASIEGMLKWIEWRVFPWIKEAKCVSVLCATCPALVRRIDAAAANGAFSCYLRDRPALALYRSFPNIPHHIKIQSAALIINSFKSVGLTFSWIDWCMFQYLDLEPQQG